MDISSHPIFLETYHVVLFWLKRSACAFGFWLDHFWWYYSSLGLGISILKGCVINSSKTTNSIFSKLCEVFFSWYEEVHLHLDFLFNYFSVVFDIELKGCILNSSWTTQQISVKLCGFSFYCVKISMQIWIFDSIIFVGVATVFWLN